MRIQKSRYDSIDSYLSKNSEIFNDIQFEINEDAKNMLKAGGRFFVDNLVARTNTNCAYRS